MQQRSQIQVGGWKLSRKEHTALFRTLPTPINVLLPSLMVEVCLGLAPDVFFFLNFSREQGLLCWRSLFFSLTALLMIPYTWLNMLRQRLVSISLRSFTQTKSNHQVPRQTCFGWSSPLFHQSKPGLIRPSVITLETADWKSWPYTDGSCHTREDG